MKKISILGASLALGLVLTSCGSTSSSRTSSTSKSSTPSTASTTPAAPQSTKTKEAKSTTAVPAMTKAGMVTSSMSFPTGDPKTSSVQVDKMVPAQVMVGEVFPVTMRVTNLTNQSVDNVTITESLGGNLDIKSSDVKAETSAGSRVWKLGELGANEFRVINLTASAKKPERIDTCLSVTYDTALCASIPVVEPALKIVAMGTASALECEEIIYEYLVTNTGTGSADNVNVLIELPDGLTDENGRRSITRNVGSLASGKSTKFSLNAKGKASTAGFSHKAKATGANNLIAMSELVNTMISRPELTITKKGTEKSFAARNLTYDITVKNTGNGIAQDAVIEDEIPSGLAFVSATQGGRQVGSKVQWSLGDMAPGASATVNLKLMSVNLGTYVNRATARAFCAEAVSASASTVVTGIPAILLEVIDMEDPIEVGQIETYVISVTNQGTAPDTNIKITVTMPDNTEFVSVDGATAAMAGAGTNNIVNLIPVPTLAPKATAKWQVRLRGASAADARFKVEMNSDQLTSPVGETEATNYYE